MIAIRMIAVAVLLVGCGSKKTEDGERAKPPPPAEAPVEAKPPAAPKPPPFAEAEVRALIDAWLDAQNKGDFEAYQSLYRGEKFTGVKRVGTRVRRYDRAGWLKDRRRMFKKRMIVAASDIQINGSVVLFTQTWESGRYKDVGPKQLIVAREGKALRIAREEMLASKIIAPELGAGDFMFATEYGIVVEPEADRGWGKGKPELSTRSPAIVSVDVDPAKLPKELRELKGRRLVAYDARNRHCEGTVSGFTLLNGYEPYWGTRLLWDGMVDEYGGPSDEVQAEPYDDDQVAAEVWGGGQGPVWLIAEVDWDGGNGGCDGALWARPERDAHPPELAAVDTSEDEDLLALAMPMIHGTSAYSEAEKEWKDYPGGGKGRWEEVADEAGVASRKLRGPDGKKDYFAVSMGAGVGCGDFYTSLWFLFRAEGEPGKRKLELIGSGWDDLFPIAAIDIDGDGEPEFISETGLVRRVEGEYKQTLEMEIPSYEGC